MVEPLAYKRKVFSGGKIHTYEVLALAYLRLLCSDGVEIRQPCGEATESHGEPTRAAADCATSAEVVPWVLVALWQEDHLSFEGKRKTSHLILFQVSGTELGPGG